MNVSVGKSFVCVMNRFLMKLFRTNNIAIIDDCRYHFEITLPSKLIETRSQRFIYRYNTVENSLCRAFV